MEDSRDIVQLINDHGFTVKSIEADEAGVVIDGHTRMGALRKWELDLVQASAANRAAQPADQEPEPDLSGADSQTVNHNCQRCKQESNVSVPAQCVLVGGCIEFMHIETRWLCDGHWRKLLNGSIKNERMPYCMTCYAMKHYNHWADYVKKEL